MSFSVNMRPSRSISASTNRRPSASRQVDRKRSSLPNPLIKDEDQQNSRGFLTSVIPSISLENPPASKYSSTKNTSKSQSSVRWARKFFVLKNTKPVELYAISSDEETRNQRRLVQRNRARKSLSSDFCHKDCNSSARDTSSLSLSSLDGSFSSEQTEHTTDLRSANAGNTEADGNPWSVAVKLVPTAMATLQALSGSSELHEEGPVKMDNLARNISTSPEMQQKRPLNLTNILIQTRTHLHPGARKSSDVRISLEIPSPGSFFSALSPRAREAWNLNLPKSSIAERFYNGEWRLSHDDALKIVPQTLPSSNPIQGSLFGHLEPGNPSGINREHPYSLPEDTISGAVTGNPINESDENLNDIAVTRLYRTIFWVADQSLLAELKSHNKNELEIGLTHLNRTTSNQKSQEKVEASPNNMIEIKDSVDRASPKIGRSKSASDRSFQDTVTHFSYSDISFQNIPRFEAFPSQLLCSPTLYSVHLLLLSKYQVNVPLLEIQRCLPPDFTKYDVLTPLHLEELRSSMKYGALRQILPAIWNMMAVKFLNSGRLIAAPVAERLAHMPAKNPKNNRSTHDRIRILDLSGQVTCDWAWHCAVEYPEAQVYTVTAKAMLQDTDLKIRGPRNHKVVIVDGLNTLPFRDNQFDLISARDIHMILKSKDQDGKDGWDTCLKECMRILKPGGSLEFCIFDSDIVNAGPLGAAKNSEFGSSLRALGYDPHPSERWLGRLKNADFVGIKRAWLFLPMDVQSKDQISQKINLSAPGKTKRSVSGSPENLVNLFGLVGAWAWEKWFLRYKLQTGGVEGSLDGVQSIIKEGNQCGAGWRCVSGWARKPGGRYSMV